MVGEGDVPGSETEVHIFFIFYPMTIYLCSFFYHLSSSIFFVHCRVLQIGPLGGTQNGLLSGMSWHLQAFLVAQEYVISWHPQHF